MAGMAVTGTLVMSHASDKGVETCRGLLFATRTDYAAATAIEDLLLVRYLGNSTERAQQLFRSIWRLLRPAALGRAASPPRIWDT